MNAGVNSKLWLVTARLADYGLLDLFLLNSAKWTPAFDRLQRRCGDTSANGNQLCRKFADYYGDMPGRLFILPLCLGQMGIHRSFREIIYSLVSNLPLAKNPYPVHPHANIKSKKNKG